jgi:hypothetical protein
MRKSSAKPSPVQRITDEVPGQILVNEGTTRIPPLWDATSTNVQ